MPPKKKKKQLTEAERKARYNLLRLLGRARYKCLFGPPFELRITLPIPYSHWEFEPGLEWILSPEGRCWLVHKGMPAISGGRERNGFCVHPANGFARVPAADKVLALLLWIKADENSFSKRDFPKAAGDRRGQGRLEQWDALVAGHQVEDAETSLRK